MTTEYPEFLGLELHIWAYILGGILAFLSVILSIYLIIMHIKYNTNATLRSYIIRIIAMAPIYGLAAWFGLLNDAYSNAFDIVREAYEAYVIYVFYVFLLAYLSDGKSYAGYIKFLLVKYPILSLDPDSISKNEIDHVFPINLNSLKSCFKCCGCKCLNYDKDWCLLRKWNMGPDFLFNTMFGTFQYVFFRGICTIATFLLSIDDLYHAGELNFSYGYPYIATVLFISQFYAMYCLILFYHAFYEDLKPINPLPKFLCIKLVVFFTFWQSIVLSILVKINVVTSTEAYTSDQSSAGIQDFCICCEMFLATFGHMWAFPPKEFNDPNFVSKKYVSKKDYFLRGFWPNDDVDLNDDLDVLEVSVVNNINSNINYENIDYSNNPFLHIANLTGAHHSNIDNQY
jgi:hypothetical protein